jgi:hypothetical protein
MKLRYVSLSDIAPAIFSIQGSESETQKQNNLRRWEKLINQSQ